VRDLFEQFVIAEGSRKLLASNVDLDGWIERPGDGKIVEATRASLRKETLRAEAGTSLQVLPLEASLARQALRVAAGSINQCGGLAVRVQADGGQAFLLQASTTCLGPTCCDASNVVGAISVHADLCLAERQGHSAETLRSMDCEPRPPKSSLTPHFRLAVDSTGEAHGPFYVAENKAIGPVKAENFVQTSAVSPHVVVRPRTLFSRDRCGRRKAKPLKRSSSKDEFSLARGGRSWLVVGLAVAEKLEEFMVLCRQDLVAGC
jgi:hypothetical protein